LIVYFGFLYPHKRVERLFDVCDPTTDRLVIAGEATVDALSYRDDIANRAASPPWAGRATLTGFMPAKDIAALLAAADAVVLPFQHGGGNWNTSIHAARSQGTFVVTTSDDRSGYDPAAHVWYTTIDDVNGMRTALAQHAGRKRASDAGYDVWKDVAAKHVALYRELLGNAR
jgi:glycosyltransferase involved in cell wall biosynthesis